MAEDVGTQGPDPLTVTPLGGGRYRVVDAHRQRLAYAAGPPHARWVFLDGLVHVIDLTAPGDGTQVPERHDEQALAPPMAATVAAINVSPGQRVAPGDVLILLEAMKMELPIKAPRAGTVTAVACAVGDFVQPGVPLVELE